MSREQRGSAETRDANSDNGAAQDAREREPVILTHEASPSVEVNEASDRDSAALNKKSVAAAFPRSMNEGTSEVPVGHVSAGRITTTSSAAGDQSRVDAAKPHGPRGLEGELADQPSDARLQNELPRQSVQAAHGDLQRATVSEKLPPDPLASESEISQDKPIQPQQHGAARTEPAGEPASTDEVLLGDDVIALRATRARNQEAAEAIVASQRADDEKLRQRERVATSQAENRTIERQGDKRSDSVMHTATKDAIDELLNAQPVDADRAEMPKAPEAPVNSERGSNASTHGASRATTLVQSNTPATFENTAVAFAAPQSLPAPPASGTLIATASQGEIDAQGSSSSADTASWMTRNDHAAGRILRGMSAMIHQHGGSLTMRLDPPELGSLRIQMAIANGSVSATFTPGTDAARGLLEQNISQLKAALESQGLFVDRLVIQSAAPQQPNAHTSQQQGTDSGGAQDQQGQYADAGDGESRGRSEQHQHEHRRDQQLFDLNSLFDATGGLEMAPAKWSRAKQRISA